MLLLLGMGDLFLPGGASRRERRQMIIARSAPSRFAVRTLSMATFPPPITAVFFAREDGRIVGRKIVARIRLTRPYSPAEYTPTRFSPGSS